MSSGHKRARSEVVLDPGDESIPPGPRLAIINQSLASLCENFVVSNVHYRTQFAVYCKYAIRLLNTAPPGAFASSGTTLDTLDVMLRKFTLRLFDRLKTRTFYTRAYQSVGTKPENQMTMRERWTLILNQRETQRKFGFTNPPTSVNGVSDTKLLHEHVAAYMPSEADQKHMNGVMIEERREELFRWAKKAKLVHEDRVSMLDTLAAVWFSVKATQYDFGRPKVGNAPTVGQFIGLFPPLDEKLAEMGVNKAKFREQPDYTIAPRSIMYTVDSFSDKEMGVSLMDCTLDTALHLLQFIGAMMWWIPLWDARFEAWAVFLEMRLAHLVTNTGDKELMNAAGMYVLSNQSSSAAYTELFGEDEPFPDMTYSFSREEQDEMEQKQPRFVGLFASRMVFSVLRGLWYLKSRAVAYADSVVAERDPEMEQSINMFLTVASDEYQLSEQQVKDTQNDLVVSYVTPGSRFIYGLLNTALPMEDRLVVPHTWGSKAFTLIRKNYSRPGREVVVDEATAPHLRTITAFHILDGYFNRNGFDGFMERYVSFNDIEKFDVLYRSKKMNQKEPLFIKVANQFMVLFRGKAVRCHNDPALLIREFFLLVANQCHCKLSGVSIRNILVEMGVVPSEPGTRSSMLVGDMTKTISSLNRTSPLSFGSS
jgi:hypothetical protein